MMFTCFSSECGHPWHAHAAAARRPSKSAGAKAQASTKFVRDRKGRSLRIDIHCHYHNAEAAAKVAHLNPAQFEPALIFANQITRDFNLKQMEIRAAKLSTIEVRLKDMDAMGIDIQAVSPNPFQCYYWAEPGLGLELSRMVNDRLAEIVAGHPDSVTERRTGDC